MAADFDDEHQRSQPPHRAHEVLDVSGAVGAKALYLVIEPGHDGAAERHHRHGGRRLEEWDQPKQVAAEDEHAQRDQVRKVAAAGVADDLFALRIHVVVNPSMTCCSVSGLLDREAGPNGHEKQIRIEEDQELHCDVVGNGVVGMSRMSPAQSEAQSRVRQTNGSGAR